MTESEISALLPALATLPRWCTHIDKKPTPAVGQPGLTLAQALARGRGLGFFLGPPYVGVDIDEMTPLAAQVLRMARACGAYVERSLSGRGWHIIGRGCMRNRGKRDGVEAYASGRYFVMTCSGEGDTEVDIQAICELLEPPERTSAGSTREWDPELLEWLDPDCGYDEWLRVGMALHSAGVPLGVWESWSREGAKWEEGACERHWRSFSADGGVTLGTLYEMARAAGRPEARAEEFDPPGQNWWLARAIRAETLTGPPPERRWVWREWIPEGVVTGLAGPPGVAKSTLALQLCVHRALGIEFLGAEIARGPALYITVEDDGPELHRRLHRICDALLVGPEELEGLLLVPATELATGLLSGGRPTPRYEALRELLLERRPMLVLDLIGDFWDGDENVRAEVSSYVRAVLGRLVSETGCACVGISHLNKAGLVSGSTAWEGSYRSLMVMSRDGEGELELRRAKANYAPPLADPIGLAWEEGYLRRRVVQATPVPVELLEVGRWYGVDALAAEWQVGRQEARRWAAQGVREGFLQHREHGGRDQYASV